MTPAAGEVWAGRFRVEGAPVGEGASTLAVPAVDDDTGRSVVLRPLHPHLIGDPVAEARIRALAGAAGRLAHAHVATVRGIWSEDGRPFLVADRVDGIPLDRLDGPLPPEAALTLGVQVCEALVAAHAAGLVHGDLRPGHVLVGLAGASVIDFGPAVDAPPPVRPGQTAPEVQAGATPGRAADLYGLGVVLYRALTGEMPFRADTPFATLALQRQGATPPRGPEGLARLVGELLHPEPLRRPGDAAAVLGALRRLQRDPARLARPARRWVAPIRPARAWVVHGIDPVTGGEAVVRGELRRGEAAQLVRTLRDEGWEVLASREALAWRDLAWVALLAVAVGFAVPPVGVALGAVLGLLWRTSLVEPRIREVLPAVRADLPAPLVDQRDSPVAAAVCLLLMAAGLWLEPWTALLPAVALLVLVARAVRRPPSADRVALRARVSALLGDLRRAVEHGVGDLDRSLALQGELEALEGAWRDGRLDDEVALARADALERRLHEALADRPPAHARRGAARPRTGVETDT